ncbi:MAG: alpha/beta hydrolase [Xanthomonadales bacterium]|nr:alpha/beta hydrolase [Xanthomonadales bacterium]
MSFRAATWVLVLGGSLTFAPFLAATEPFEIPLWQGIAPSSEGAVAVIEVTEERGAPGKPNRWVTGVTIPTITVYRAQDANNTGAAILVMPGGGYAGLAIDKEGHDVARYLNSIGLTGIVLKYRLPRPDGFVFAHDVPLRDATRALRMIRHRAREWAVDSTRVGVMGFSAGGHLASTLATQFGRIRGNPDDPVDGESARPDFQVLVYPVISFKDRITHAGSRRNLVSENPPPELVDRYSNELQVTDETPPAFLVSTYDDPVKAENSLLYFKALRAAGVQAELHIYEVGGHGYGIIPTGKPVASWHHRMFEWMKQRALLTR